MRQHVVGDYIKDLLKRDLSNEPLRAVMENVYKIGDEVSRQKFLRIAGFLAFG